MLELCCKQLYELQTERHSPCKVESRSVEMIGSCIKYTLKALFLWCSLTSLRTVYESDRRIVKWISLKRFFQTTDSMWTPTMPFVSQVTVNAKQQDHSIYLIAKSTWDALRQLRDVHFEPLAWERDFPLTLTKAMTRSATKMDSKSFIFSLFFFQVLFNSSKFKTKWHSSNYRFWCLAKVLFLKAKLIWWNIVKVSFSVTQHTCIKLESISQHTFVLKNK